VSAIVNVIASKDGTQIAYEQRGDGPPLVVVDGALNTRMSGSKAALVDLLSPELSVYCYDRRGRGDSGETLPYGRRAGDRGHRRADRCGWRGRRSLRAFVGRMPRPRSGGGLGTKVSKAALYEAPYNDDPVAQKAWGKYIEGLNEALAEDRRGDAVALFMRYGGTPADQVDGMRQAPWWSELEAIAPTLAYDHPGIMGRTAAVPTERLAAVLAPTLVMCGGSSYPFMRTTAETIAQALPYGQLQVLDGQSHNLQPEVLCPVLTEFFRKW